MYFGICFTKRQFDCRELKAYGGKIMTNVSIYKDIAARTGGDIYIGIVGPVRTGKSTFIKQFMDKLVLPNISGDYRRRGQTTSCRNHPPAEQ